MTGALAGADGKLRCPWALSAPDYVAYHDDEWGRPVADDDAMFERLSLEAFQSGLSWLVILRKRPAFRDAFDHFHIERVARYTDRDVERLLADAGIVRNRAKIEATIANARAAAELPDGLRAHLSSFAPAEPGPAPATVEEIRSSSPESVAMAKDLRRRNFRFVGSVTGYALLQATGLVDDHLAECWRRGHGV